MTNRPELRTILSSAVDEVIDDYETRAWILSSEKDDAKLTPKGRRNARRHLHALAAKHFPSLIAEIRHLRTGPYITPDDNGRSLIQLRHDVTNGGSNG